MATVTPNTSPLDDDLEAYEQVVGTYRPGSIRRIRLRNFLTYKNVDFCPGPRMNMVMGPNGTGKSSILNAICLGLGGSPKLLGRADSLGDYIAHGHETASIEITLEGEESSITIQRDIEGESSTWKLNGKNSTKAKVDAVVKEYHILLDNLCTFLPQDRVGKFSSLNSKDLLEETQLALGGVHNSLHKKLIQLETDLKQSSSDATRCKDQFQRLERETQGLEREAERYQERRECLKRHELLGQRHVWLRVEEVRQKALDFKEKRKELKQELRQYQGQLEPLQAQVEITENAQQQAQSRVRELEGQRSKAKQEMTKQAEKYSKHDEGLDDDMTELVQVDQAKNELLQLKSQQEDRVASLAEKLQKEEKSPDEAKADLQEKRAAQTSVMKDSERAKKWSKQLENQAQELEHEAQQAQTKLSKLNDEAGLRRQRIFRNFPDLGRIADWLKQHSSKFRGPVIGPVCAHMVCKNADMARLVEQHCPNWLLKAFVVENKSDYDLLYDQVKAKGWKGLNIVNIEGQAATKQRPYDQAKMSRLKQEFAVSGFLDEYVKAPASVMVALQLQASLHKALVAKGSSQLNEQFQELVTQDGSRKMNAIVCCTGNHLLRLSFIVSKYGNRAVSMRQDDTPPMSERSLLSAGVAPHVREKAEADLQAANEKLNKLRPDLEEARGKLQELERQVQQVRADAVSAKQLLEVLTKVVSKHRGAEEKLQGIVADLEALDTSSKKRRLMEKCQNRVDHSIKALEMHAKAHKQILDANFKGAGLMIARQELGVAAREAREALQEKKQEFAHLEAQYTQVERQYQTARQTFSKLKAEAEAAAPIEDNNGQELPLKEQLSALGVESLAECEAAMEEAMQTANQYVDNPEALRQFEQKKEELSSLRDKLDELNESRDSKIQSIRKQADPWESALRNKLTKVSALFGSYMKEMDCVGEVNLQKGTVDEDDPDQVGNYKEWGIQICVGFREAAKAQVLSAMTHSGGERSVSTILYLMALQHLMTSPFRCVDEINQGLDERNERLVFKRIVANATKPPKEGNTRDHSGQYFLITPKLLPNLEDMENEGVTALVVFNGSYNFEKPTDWNVEELIEGAGKGQKRGSDENEANGSSLKSRKQGIEA